LSVDQRMNGGDDFFSVSLARAKQRRGAPWPPVLGRR
jgi:hypothetical protein